LKKSVMVNEKGQEIPLIEVLSRILLFSFIMYSGYVFLYGVWNLFVNHAWFRWTFIPMFFVVFITIAILEFRLQKEATTHERDTA
jgi:hypothetical protein